MHQAVGRVQPDKGPATLCVAGVTFVADPAGALYLEGERLLIVADLHLEKGSAYAERRVFLPPYDTAATLARLSALVSHYRPRAVALLGDSFHDVRADGRMGEPDRARLLTLQATCDLIFVAGNHDPDVPLFLGTSVPQLEIKGITLRHEPQADPGAGEIAGHLHPVARVVSQSGSVRRRCFVSDGRRCIMPAFGAYAGGLNIRDVAFGPLLKGRVKAHVMGRAAIYAVDPSSCVGD